MTSSCSRFFKIILRKCIEDGTLKIPNKFTKKFSGELPNPMFLKPPDGTEWKVYLNRNDAEIWFQKGWKEFATHYSLDHGHLVVFEYEGTSHFEVHIFDMSSLEIEYHCHEQISDDSSKKKRVKSPVSSPQPHKKLRACKTGDAQSNPNLQSLLQHIQTEDGKSTQRTLKLTNPCAATTGNMKEAKKFTSENPSFIINIRQCYLEKTRPSIPGLFARKYFNKKKQNVMIQYRKKSWLATTLYYRSIPHALFSSGWKLFAQESELQVGDVCVFELINIEDAVFQVHAFRGQN